MKQNRVSIYYILFIIITFTVVLVVGIYSSYKYVTTKETMINEVKYNSSVTLAKLNNNVKDFIISYSPTEYNNLILNEMTSSNIIAIIINDYKLAKVFNEKNFYSGKIREDSGIIENYNQHNALHKKLLETSAYTSEHDILDDDGNIVGKIKMYNSKKDIDKKLQEIISDNIKNVIFLSIFMTIFLFIAIRFFLLKYIFSISKKLENRDENGIPLSFLDESGPKEISNLSHTINDMIKAIKASNLQLNYQIKEFETIFSYSKDGLAILDLRSNFLDFNEAYLKMTGFTREELLTKSCIGLSLPEDIESSKQAMKEIIEKGFLEDFEKVCLTKDGDVVVTNMSAALLPDKKRVLVSAKDLTERKVMESQAKLASMGEMIGNIAHQWRQPLSAISTIASGIKLKEEFGLDLDKNDVISGMDTIMEQSQYLSHTIDDFRNFIKDTEKESEVYISKVLGKTLSILNSTLINDNIKLILDKEEDIKISAYENELIQSFINIINNAKDALNEMENEEDKLLFITTKKTEKEFIVSIKDSAGGIQKEYMEKIFEPYFTTKHKSIGTGIGLSMVHQIITEHHNATIKAFNESFKYNNKAYKGARFDISFKLA